MRRVAELRPHPSAGRVPTLPAEEYGQLRADIAERGLQVPLEINRNGEVLDGCERLRAARDLGIESVEVRLVDVEDEATYVALAAVRRRHLNPGQRAALTTTLLPLSELRTQANERQRANLRQNQVEGAPIPARGERIRDQLAEAAGTSPRTAQDVLTVSEHNPELLGQVLRGEISAKTAASKVRRELRDKAIPQPPPLPQGPFELILADPPWSYGSPDSDFAPERHYPTMTLSELKQLRLPAADDCVLFCWAVNCLLLDALELVRAWGFQYRNNLAWVKPSIGPGIWLRQRHELLLIATRGQVSPPDPEDRCDSVIEAARGGHSEKPPRAYELIERMYPQRSKLELFARGVPRPGWKAWGNQAQSHPEDAA